MARRRGENNPKSLITWQGAAIGSLLSIGWVALTAYFFTTHLIGSSPNRDELLTELMWPAVIMALGVPVIIFLWFGGSSVVMGLVRLRDHLEKLDEYVSSFDEMESKSSEIRQNLDGASATVTAAANTFSANLERFDQDVRPVLETHVAALTRPGHAPAGPNTPEDAETLEKKRSLGQIIQMADTIFYDALARRNEKPGRGKRRIVVAPGGADKYEISKQLAEEGFLTPDQATILIEAYTLDMTTRPTGRRGLVKSALAALEDRFQSLGLNRNEKGPVSPTSAKTDAG